MPSAADPLKAGSCRHNADAGEGGPLRTELECPAAVAPRRSSESKNESHGAPLTGRAPGKLATTVVFALRAGEVVALRRQSRRRGVEPAPEREAPPDCGPKFRSWCDEQLVQACQLRQSRRRQSRGPVDHQAETGRVRALHPPQQVFVRGDTGPGLSALESAGVIGNPEPSCSSATRSELRPQSGGRLRSAAARLRARLGVEGTPSSSRSATLVVASSPARRGGAPVDSRSSIRRSARRQHGIPNSVGVPAFRRRGIVTATTGFRDRAERHRLCRGAGGVQLHLPALPF